MVAKIIVLKRKGQNPAFFMKLVQNQKQSYKAITTPFGVEDWNLNPKKRKNELKSVPVPKSGEKTTAYSRFITNQNWILMQESRYQGIINELIIVGRGFTFGKIWRIAEGNTKATGVPVTVYKFWDWHIKNLRDKNDDGNADSFIRAKQKLKKFHKPEMVFDEMDTDFLLEFRLSMESRGASRGYVSNILRSIRRIYNLAVEKGIAKRDNYPFADRQVMKNLKTKHKSRAINKDDVDAIRRLRLSCEQGSDIFHGASYFLLSYLSFGVNFADWARFKWTDIIRGRLYYVRYKTRKSIDDKVNFGVKQEMDGILSYYRLNNRQLGNDYILPVLNATHDTDYKIHARIKTRRRWINNCLKLVADEVGIEIPLTTYVARHTAASTGKLELGLTTSQIQELMNHQDSSTTEAYLASFSDKQRDKMVEGL